MKTIECLYKGDNCSTKTEFIEKAIRFYCGYLLQNKPELIDYLAPQIGTITDGIVKGSDCFEKILKFLYCICWEVVYNICCEITMFVSIAISFKSIDKG